MLDYSVKIGLVLMRRNTTDRPQTHGTYLWAEFDNLQKIEDRLLDGPYIHHFVEIEGDYTKEIEEFCKYFPGLQVDTFEK